MQADARSTTHPVQQPITTEAQAGTAFDEIAYRKGQSIIRMLESFLGENVFRDGIRKYIAAHKYSNTTTADLWQALTEVSGKPVGELAPGWTEQPGFPLVKVRARGEHDQAIAGAFHGAFPKPARAAMADPAHLRDGGAARDERFSPARTSGESA